MLDLTKNIFKAADKVDKFTESAQERGKTLTDRHAADMASDNWLSKSIRPLSLLILLGLQCFVVVFSTFGHHVDSVIVGQLGTLLLGAFGFYFNSKKIERVASQNAKANIEMEKLKTKQELKQERKQLRHDRRMERRRFDNQDREENV